MIKGPVEWDRNSLKEMKAGGWDSICVRPDLELLWSTLCGFISTDNLQILFPLNPILSPKLTVLCFRLPEECAVFPQTPDVPNCIHFLHPAPPALSSVPTLLSVLGPLSALSPLLPSHSVALG